MMNAYGTARVMGRLLPHDLEAVARYVRREHGPHTSVDYLLTEMEMAAGVPPKARRSLWAAVQAVVRALRAAAGGNGRAANTTHASRRPG